MVYQYTAKIDGQLVTVSAESETEARAKIVASLKTKRQFVALGRWRDLGYKIQEAKR